MKKFIIIVSSCIVAFGLLLAGCNFLISSYCSNFRRTHSLYIEKKTMLSLSDCEILNSVNNSGFHGDGKSYTIFRVDDNFEDRNSSELNKWNDLPMDEDLLLLCYGGVSGSTVYAYEYLKKVNIPQINNGYYKFVDLNNGSGSLLNRSLRDFYISIYDKDSKKLYYYEFHS